MKSIYRCYHSIYRTHWKRKTSGSLTLHRRVSQASKLTFLIIKLLGAITDHNKILQWLMSTLAGVDLAKLCRDSSGELRMNWEMIFYDLPLYALIVMTL